MAKIRVKINAGGARALLNSGAVQADLKRRADAIAGSAGVGYLPSVQAGRNRARASVITAEFAAILDNYRRNTLLKNLDRGR